MKKTHHIMFFSKCLDNLMESTISKPTNPILISLNLFVERICTNLSLKIFKTMPYTYVFNRGGLLLI